jgi:hypothetical protein
MLKTEEHCHISCAHSAMTITSWAFYNEGWTE